MYRFRKEHNGSPMYGSSCYTDLTERMMVQKFKGNHPDGSWVVRPNWSDDRVETREVWDVFHETEIFPAKFHRRSDAFAAMKAFLEDYDASR